MARRGPGGGGLIKTKTKTTTVYVTRTVYQTTPLPTTVAAALPDETEEPLPHGKEADDEEELEDSWKMFFILIVLSMWTQFLNIMNLSHDHPNKIRS